MRRTPAERKQLLEEQKRKIEARLQAMSAREREKQRKLDTRQKVIVGAAVLAHAEIDPAFAVILRSVLRRAVQRPADQESIGNLLEPITNTTSDVAK